VSDSHWDAIAREYHALYGEFSRTSPLRHGAVETLAALRDRGFVQSVLSASEQAILEGAIVQRGIRDFFGQVGGLPDLYAHSKIHLGRRVIGDAETAAGQTLIVGDTTHDYEVSQELGCPCVLLAGGHQSPQRLSRCACPLFEDFAGLGNYLLRLARRSRSDRPTDAAAEI
jgi:phosphoglycolate phosphatase